MHPVLNSTLSRASLTDGKVSCACATEPFRLGHPAGGVPTVLEKFRIPRETRLPTVRSFQNVLQPTHVRRT